MHLRTLFTADEIRTAQLVEPFDFSEGMPLMRIDTLRDPRRIPIHDDANFGNIGAKLLDLLAGPGQADPIDDPLTAARLEAIIIRIFAEHDVPREICVRMGRCDTAGLAAEEERSA